MNQLDFSPISQKDQQSIDTFSFLHNNPRHVHRPKYSQSTLTASIRLFQKLSRIYHNRQSYSFQLLKQFILFSSDEETIQIHYRYGQFQLQQGIEHMQNTYGMHVKLTLVKAFQDIQNYSKKKVAYENIISINRLINVYDKIMRLNKQQSYRNVFKILAKYIQKQIINNKTPKKQQKSTQDLINNLQKQIYQIQKQKYAQIPQIEQVQTQQKQLSPQSPKYKSQRQAYPIRPIHSIQPIQSVSSTRQRKIIIQDRDINNIRQKPSKFQTISHQRQKQYQTNQWRQQVQDIDSYDQAEQQQQLAHIDADIDNDIDIDNPRIIIKSMSNQLHSHNRHNKQYLQSTRHKYNNTNRNYDNGNKNYGLMTMISENKCKSTQITPMRNNNNQDYDVFRTKRRNQSLSMIKKSCPQPQGQYQIQQYNNNSDGIQNVIIIRSSKQYKRQPDRYIRVPITSQQVKIVQLIPQSSRKRGENYRQKYQMEKKLQTISSRHRTSSGRGHKPSSQNKKHIQYIQHSQHLQNSQHSSRGNRKENMNKDIIIQTNSKKSKSSHQSKSHQSSKNPSQSQYSSNKDQLKNSSKRKETSQDLHDCIGCKYCEIIKDMELYRVQRTGTAKRICLI